MNNKPTILKIPLYFVSFVSLIFLLISIICFNDVNEISNVAINCIISVLAIFFVISFFRLFFESDGSFGSILFLIFIPLLILFYYALVLYSNNYPNLDFKFRVILLVCLLFVFLLIPAIVIIVSHSKSKEEQEAKLKDIEIILNERPDLFDILTKYLSDDFSCCGALFINGDWGSGKTFYLNKFLTNFSINNKKSKFINVSLNGLESISELQERMFWNNHPRSHAFFESRIGKTTETILRKIGFSFKEIKQDKLNARLVVFDDLERSSIDTIKLFGLIDSILSAKIKVILVGNEIEIKDPFNPGEYDNNRLISAILLHKCQKENINQSDISTTMKEIESSQYYDRIKEKVICLSYHFNFQFLIFVNHIVGKYKSIVDITMQNISFIEKMVKKFRCNNLRVCETALIYFEEINKAINDIVSKEDEMKQNKEFVSLLKKNVLLYVVYCTIKEKIPNIYETKDNKKIDFGDYPSSYGITMAFKTIKDNVNTLRLDKNEFSIDIKNEFLEYKVTKNEKLPDSMYKLRENLWDYMNDQDVIKYVNAMLDDFHKKLVPISKIYLVYHYFFVYKEYYNFNSDYTLEDILNEALTQIDNAAPEKLIKFKEKIFDTNFFLNQYPIGERLGLKKIIDRMVSMCTKAQVNNLNNSFSNMNELINNIDKYSAQAIERKSFLSSIDKQNIENIIKSGTNADIVNLRETLRDVYGSTNIKEFFKADVEAIENLSKSLSSFREALKDIPNLNIKKKNLELLSSDLENIKERLQQKHN